MPPKEKVKTEDAATPAIAEVVDPKETVQFKFQDHVYSFRRKRLTATQFRLPSQKGYNEVAVEWLLGPAQFQVFLNRTAGEDGTSQDVFFDFIEALGNELGTGNF